MTLAKLPFFCLLVWAGCCCLAGCNKADHNDSAPNATAALTDEQALVKAAGAGELAAQLRLAKRFDGAEGGKPNLTGAFEWYLRAAQAGNLDAMLIVSDRMFEGIGTRQNDSEARKWLKQAAEKGNPKAQYEFALKGPERDRGMFAFGDTLLVFDWGDTTALQNLEEITSWFEKASANNSVDANRALGQMFYVGVRHDFFGEIMRKPEPEKAVPYLNRAAELGDWQAQFALAQLLQEGKKPVAQDSAASMKWWDSLKLQTSPDIQVKIGNTFDYESKEDWKKYHVTRLYRGRRLSFEESSNVAKEWYEKAYAQGNAEAAYRLAVLYAEGRGPYESARQAAEYLTYADDKGNGNARLALAQAYLDGAGVPKDHAKAIELLLKSTKDTQLISRAQYTLGRLYLLGNGVESDPRQAYAWFNLASANGHYGAKQELVSLGRKMSGAQQSEAQAMSRAWTPGLGMAGVGASESGKNRAGSGFGEALKAASYGTGFMISQSGNILTNRHVVASCKEIRVPAISKVAKRIVVDEANDLAIVNVEGDYNAVAPLPDGNDLRQGDEVVVFGYPLEGYLPSSGNLTLGVVSALAGPGNNASLIQITAPVQQGNSGGPVLDKKGRVVGVVVGKADAIKVAKLTGDIPQNVNFAIEVRTVKAFLDGNRIDYRTKGGLLARAKSTADLADEARSYSLKLECWR